MRTIEGSKSDRLKTALINSMVNSGWFPSGIADEDRNRLIFVAVTGLQGFKPTDEIEAMIAAQAMAAHFTSMECSRRAMLHEQPFEAAQGLRKAAANASRIFVELLSALDRKRGKGGQQKLTVEHVHVHSGGQAVVGNIATDGRGEGRPEMLEKPRGAPARLAHDAPLAQSCPRCGARTRAGNRVRSAAMRNRRRCRLHGGQARARRHRRAWRGFGPPGQRTVCARPRWSRCASWCGNCGPTLSGWWR